MDISTFGCIFGQLHRIPHLISSGGRECAQGHNACGNEQPKGVHAST